MTIDFEPYFKQYETLVAVVDQTFRRMQNEYPDAVKCEIECCDCCYALFDLSLIEALYINHMFNETLPGDEKKLILEKANRIDRKIYKLKKQAYEKLKNGKNEGEIIADMAVERARCPLLNDDDKCDLYACRPITCRFYGIPTAIGGEGHTCGKSGFETGRQYPTVNLEIINDRLNKISMDVAASLNTKFSKLADLFVPLSMALLTVYNKEYLGIADTEKTVNDKEDLKNNEYKGDRNGKTF